MRRRLHHERTREQQADTEHAAAPGERLRRDLVVREQIVEAADRELEREDREDRPRRRVGVDEHGEQQDRQRERAEQTDAVGRVKSPRPRSCFQPPTM